MKSVPNLISYLHDFFRNFSQFLAIYFELFSFGVIFNSEIADEWAPPVRRRAPRRARAAARRCRVAATRRADPRADNALSGRRRVPIALASFRPCHAASDRARTTAPRRRPTAASLHALARPPPRAAHPASDRTVAAVRARHPVASTPLPSPLHRRRRRRCPARRSRRSRARA